MTEIPPSDFRSRAMSTIGAQPIAMTAAALVLIVSGIGAILLWRMATGLAPETDRAVAGRQIQVRVAQTSEQIMEKAKGLEMSQQESIDQLQAVQDQLRTLQQLITAQRSETKKLSDQVTEIGSSLDGLRQSYASAQPGEASERPAASKPAARSARGKSQKSLRKRTKARRSVTIKTPA